MNNQIFGNEDTIEYQDDLSQFEVLYKTFSYYIFMINVVQKHENGPLDKKSNNYIEDMQEDISIIEYFLNIDSVQAINDVMSFVQRLQNIETKLKTIDKEHAHIADINACLRAINNVLYVMQNYLLEKHAVAISSGVKAGIFNTLL